jgi:hypothetical protein
VLAVALDLLSAAESGDWDTYTRDRGSVYPLVEYGCQRKEDVVIRATRKLAS